MCVLDLDRFHFFVIATGFEVYNWMLHSLGLSNSDILSTSIPLKCQFLNHQYLKKILFSKEFILMKIDMLHTITLICMMPASLKTPSSWAFNIVLKQNMDRYAFIIENKNHIMNKQPWVCFSQLYVLLFFFLLFF